MTPATPTLRMFAVCRVVEVAPGGNTWADFGPDCLAVLNQSLSMSLVTSGLEQPIPIITKLNSDGTIGEEFIVATEKPRYRLD
jgi:hypothetical protein